MLKRRLYPAGMMLVLIAGFFVIASVQLGPGNLRRPEPGFVPLFAATGLMGVMVAIWLNGDSRPEAPDFVSGSLIAAAFLAFTVLISLGHPLLATAASLLLVSCRTDSVGWPARLLFTLVVTAFAALFLALEDL